MNDYSKEEYIRCNGRWFYTQTLASNNTNPLLLFIHGGPGYGVSYSLGKFFLARCQPLLEKFTVILWDQRCAGDSFSLRDIFDRSTIQDYLEDTKMLCEYFLEKYQQQKLIIAGHSWGTTLGLLTASLYPDKVMAYIGIGQIVDGLQGEIISYHYALKKVRKHSDNYFKQLSQLGPPPHSGKQVLEYLKLHRKILFQFGGIEKTPSIPPQPRDNTRLKQWLFQLKTGFCMSLAVKNLWSSCLHAHFKSLNKQLRFPVIFICGRYDYTTPTSLVMQLYREITSTKRIYIFDKSGHRPHIEEPDKFSSVMANECFELISLGPEIPA